MEKNQEERSLLAEQREQEKEQMLEYMEQLQEEDLRVTGLPGSCQVLLPTPAKPSEAAGFEGVGHDLLSGTCSFHSIITINFLWPYETFI